MVCFKDRAESRLYSARCSLLLLGAGQNTKKTNRTYVLRGGEDSIRKVLVGEVRRWIDFYERHLVTVSDVPLSFRVSERQLNFSRCWTRPTRLPQLSQSHWTYRRHPAADLWTWTWLSRTPEEPLIWILLKLLNLGSSGQFSDRFSQPVRSFSFSRGSTWLQIMMSDEFMCIL